jgi:RNA polymerase sigma-70 factor (ECF subfamily)
VENFSDEQLVKNYLKGNDEALEFLVQKYLKPMYNFVFKYMHTAEAAEDVTQEAFLKIWKNIRKFNGKYKFKTWAFTVAKNTALDHLKKKGFVALAADNNEENPIEKILVGYEPLPEEAMAKIEDAQMVNRAVQRLPEKYGRVLSLYYKNQLNFREISEALNESIHTIKTRHLRALIYLKKELRQK